LVERQPRKGLKSEPMLIVTLPPTDDFKRSHRVAAFAGFKSKSPLHPTAGSGRFLPFAAFWTNSPHHTIMLQCDRRESAISGHSQIAGERLLYLIRSHAS